MFRVLATIAALTGVAHADAADVVRVGLADAFAKKDIAAIAKRVSDPYSGLRFCSGWDAARWKAVASGLRTAKVEKSTEHARVYRVVLDGQDRHVPIEQLNDTWLLDLNALLGPFPHM